MYLRVHVWCIKFIVCGITHGNGIINALLLLHNFERLHLTPEIELNEYSSSKKLLQFGVEYLQVLMSTRSSPAAWCLHLLFCVPSVSPLQPCHVSPLLSRFSAAMVTPHGHWQCTVYYMYLQYFDTVGWVFWPVKTVSHITYSVLAGT